MYDGNVWTVFVKSWLMREYCCFGYADYDESSIPSKRDKNFQALNVVGASTLKNVCYMGKEITEIMRLDLWRRC